MSTLLSPADSLVNGSGDKECYFDFLFNTVDNFPNRSLFALEVFSLMK